VLLNKSRCLAFFTYFSTFKWFQNFKRAPRKCLQTESWSLYLFSCCKQIWGVEKAALLARPGRHLAVSWLTECLTGTFWLTYQDTGTRALNRDCPGWNGTYGMPTIELQRNVVVRFSLSILWCAQVCQIFFVAYGQNLTEHGHNDCFLKNTWPKLQNPSTMVIWSTLKKPSKNYTFLFWDVSDYS